MRSATGPKTIIAVLVPFGGEMRTSNLTRFAIRNGFNSYKQQAA